MPSNSRYYLSLNFKYDIQRILILMMFIFILLCVPNFIESINLLCNYYFVGILTFAAFIVVHNHKKRNYRKSTHYFFQKANELCFTPISGEGM